MRSYVLLDVFTAVPMSGNALAVFTDGEGIPERAMQAAARELNLSETVFLLAPPDGADAHARIFTPTTELPFAGHPLLGTAVVVARALGSTQAVIQTAAGTFEIVVEDPAGATPSATLSHGAPDPEEFPRAGELLTALGLERAALPVEAASNGPVHVLVAVSDADALARLRPDLTALAALGPLAVSCFAPDGDAWRSRMFAPALGVNEDPATGSAAGPLAAHLCRHGQAELDTWIEIRQGEAIGRPSTLWARAEATGGAIDRLRVRGNAVLVGEGAMSFRGSLL